MAHKPTTLITGAGKRIGAAIAEHLAAAGHDLVLHYNHSSIEPIKERLAKHYPECRVHTVQADFSKPEKLDGFWQKLPACTALIHNASLYERDKLASFTPKNLRNHLAVNFEAPLILTQGFIEQLPERVSNGNVIVLGDDTFGRSISPNFFTYAVSKHAWRSTIELLASACAPKVRANMIALAPTLKNMSESDAMWERLAMFAPLKRTGEVNEVLLALDFLLNSPGMTGQILGLGNGLAVNHYRADTH